MYASILGTALTTRASLWAAPGSCVTSETSSSMQASCSRSTSTALLISSTMRRPKRWISRSLRMRCREDREALLDARPMSSSPPSATTPARPSCCCGLPFREVPLPCLSLDSCRSKMSTSRLADLRSCTVGRACSSASIDAFSSASIWARLSASATRRSAPRSASAPSALTAVSSLAAIAARFSRANTFPCTSESASGLRQPPERSLIEIMFWASRSCSDSSRTSARAATS
mmetsp:Transcript_20817/g.58018  ORF Transcript_20817/g.58018 Transcript_20817/m.58018 type:complete len:231 (+) Transcript_20817:357-1049(+)